GVAGQDAAADADRRERRDDGADAADGERLLPVEPGVAAVAIVVVEGAGDAGAEQAVLQHELAEHPLGEDRLVVGAVAWAVGLRHEVQWLHHGEVRCKGRQLPAAGAAGGIGVKNWSITSSGSSGWARWTIACQMVWMRACSCRVSIQDSGTR